MLRWFERLRAQRSVRALSKWWAESPWVALVPKALGLMTGLMVLGIVGSGAIDHLFASRQANALDAIGGAHGALDLQLRASGSAFASASASAATSASAAPAPSTSALASASGAPVARLALNTATAAELDKLPGIGPQKAQKIIELRDKLGRFRRLEDLYRIKGIKRRLLERIRPLVILDADDAPPKP